MGLCCLVVSKEYFPFVRVMPLPESVLLLCVRGKYLCLKSEPRVCFNVVSSVRVECVNMRGIEDATVVSPCNKCPVEVVEVHDWSEVIQSIKRVCRYFHLCCARLKSYTSLTVGDLLTHTLQIGGCGWVNCPEPFLAWPVWLNLWSSTC